MGTQLTRCIVAGACLLMLLALAVPGPAEGTDRHESDWRQQSPPGHGGGPRDLVSAASPSDAESPPAAPGSKPSTESPPKPEPEKKAGEEKTDEVTQLKHQIIDLENKGKIGFRKFVVCSSIEGYGVYSPIEGPKAPGVLLLYVEPANVSTLVSDGRYVVDLSVDLVVSDSSGKVLGAKKGIAQIHRVSRSPVLDLHFSVKFQPPKGNKQELVVTTVIHDRIKNQRASKNIKISPNPPEKSALLGR